MGGKNHIARAPFQLNHNPPAENDTIFAPKILLFYKKTEKDNKAIAKKLEQNAAQIEDLKEQLTERDELKERLAEHERLMTELVARQTDTARKVSDQSSLISHQAKELNTKIENLDFKTR